MKSKNPSQALPVLHRPRSDGSPPANDPRSAPKRVAPKKIEASPVLLPRLLAVLLLTLFFASAVRAQIQVPVGRGIVRLEANRQTRQGDRYIADGDVDVRYLTMRLRADHIEYDPKTYDVLAR